MENLVAEKKKLSRQVRLLKLKLKKEQMEDSIDDDTFLGKASGG